MTKWTKNDEIELINKLQDDYIKELSELCDAASDKKVISFNSLTGTGKTMMMSKLMNSDWGKDKFFIITTLSRGQLHKQVKTNLQKNSRYNNFILHGVNDMTSNTIFQPADLYEEIENLNPNHNPIIWLRDEAHIANNNWSIALKHRVCKIINISATNDDCDIDCDFSTTSMLRDVTQANGGPDDALDKLLEIKQWHKNVVNYNPCAIFRCINNPALHDAITEGCAIRGLKYIDLNDDDEYSIEELCNDDNEYDVIINKMKIQEGIDIRRAHVAYLGNIPGNPNTAIQFVGRIRRNALLWRNDIDIFTEENKYLFAQTKQCFVYFNITEKEDNKEILNKCFKDFCSVEDFIPGTKLQVEDGRLSSGIKIPEIEHETGEFLVCEDPDTHFNVVEPRTNYYSTRFEEEGRVPEQGYTVTEQKLYGKKVVGYYDTISKQLIPISKYVPYKKQINDYESAQFGWDLPKYYKDSKYWGEQRALTQKIIHSSSKFARFLNQKYATELKEVCTYLKDNQLTTGGNNFSFNTLCNSCLGWLVEFYTKYLIFGKDFLFDEIKQAQIESGIDDDQNSGVIFYACYLKYRDMMVAIFGNAIKRFIKGPSVEDYIKQEYQTFVNTVIKLANQTKAYLIDELKLSFFNQGKTYDENLSVEHVAAKADFVTEDTIVDLKTTGRITKQYIYQVLGYHYLSTKRSDLNIKRVIVYDCVSGRNVIVNITPSNLTTNYCPQSIKTDLPECDISKITRELERDKILKHREQFDSACLLEPRFWFKFGAKGYAFIADDISQLKEKDKQLYMLFATEPELYTPKRIKNCSVNNERIYDLYAPSTIYSKIVNWVKKDLVYEYEYYSVLPRWGVVYFPKQDLYVSDGIKEQKVFDIFGDKIKEIHNAYRFCEYNAPDSIKTISTQYLEKMEENMNSGDLPNYILDYCYWLKDNNYFIDEIKSYYKEIDDRWNSRKLG